MMKRILLSLYLLAFACVMLAVPAKRTKHILTLQNGTRVEATLCGDEYQHWYQDAEGKCYQVDTLGVARPVDIDKVAQRGVARRQVRNAQRVARRVTMGMESNPVSGQHRCLVILCNFSDYNMTYSGADYERYFNEVGYGEHGMHGSVHDYFYDSSYGQLDLQFDVVGPVTLKKSVTYYGSNDSRGDDRHPGALITEAVEGAEAQGVDFSKYDWDGDGQVDQVFVIYAGYGEAQSGIETNIWPHEGTLSEWGYYGDGKGARTFDGVTVDRYATSCELAGSEGTEIDGIGTACHEFSHCMGLPDTYDTLNNANFAMDVWDVMDYGCYNGIGGMGNCPWGFTSYERIFCGWLTPTELKEGCEVRNMRPLSEAPEAYIIYNEANKNEYYLLENRQLTGFDAGGYGHGMLVLHVDFDKTAWANNMVNTDASHQRMTIIPADNSQVSLSKGVSYVAGDPFPGIKNKRSLTNTTLPTATLYNANSDGKKLMSKPITEIAEDSITGTVSFTFNGGYEDVIAPIQQQTETVTYDLMGRPATKETRGVVLTPGKKYLK